MHGNKPPGNAFCNGNCIEKDFHKTVLWRNEATHPNHAFAYGNFVPAYRYGEDAEKHLHTAFFWRAKATAQDYALARIPWDIPARKAPEPIKSRWTKHVAKAQYNPGHACFYSRGIEKNARNRIPVAESVQSKKPSAQGLPDLAYEEGTGIGKDPYKAVFRYEKVSLNGRSTIQTESGFIY